MKDFYSNLLEHKKWHQKDFTEEQLRHHLVECLELLDWWNSHVYAELIDLIQIAKVCLSQNLDDTKLDELTQKRYNKFISKLEGDNK